MKINSTFFLSTCLLLITGVVIEVSGQQIVASTKGQEHNVDSDAIRTQNAELKELKQELRREIELRKRQELLLEALSKKVESLEGFAAKMSSPASPAVTTTAVSTAPANAVPVTDGVVAETEKPAAAPGKSQAAAANPVESGFGRIKFNGLLQGFYAAGDQGLNDTFRVRRAELNFSGDIIPKVRWTVVFDLARALQLNTTTTNIGGTTAVSSVSVNQSSRIFQEAYITLSHFKLANISVGQFKIPLSQEGPQSSATLDTVERALFLSDRVRGGAFGDVRDQGIMAFGPLNKSVDYSIGIFNGVGEGQNDFDQNERKALVGRLVFRPSFIKGLQIGGSGAYGNGGKTSNPRRDRLGAELVYERDKLRIKSEFMGGVDGDVHRRGYYAHAGYRFLPKLETIFRFDTFDPDIRRETTAANVTERDYIVGINYYFKGNNFKFQLNYLRKTFADNISPARNILLANLQTSW